MIYSMDYLTKKPNRPYPNEQEDSSRDLSHTIENLSHRQEFSG